MLDEVVAALNQRRRVRKLSLLQRFPAGSKAITGVLDWDGVRVGDAAFDLATPLFYAYDKQPALGERGLARTTPGAFAVYLAHLILRQVDWSLRLHGTPLATQYIARGQRIRHELSTRLGMTSAWKGIVSAWL